MKKVFGLLLMVCLAMFSISCGSSSSGGSSAGFTVTISADHTIGNAPLTVHFSYSCNPSSITVSSCSWVFGDGDTSTEATPAHTYNSSGNFNVVLTVISNNGNTSTITKTITINAQPNFYSGDFYLYRETVTNRGREEIPTAVLKITQANSIGYVTWQDYGDTNILSSYYVSFYSGNAMELHFGAEAGRHIHLHGNWTSYDECHGGYSDHLFTEQTYNFRLARI